MYVDIVTNDDHRVSAGRSLPSESVMRAEKVNPTRRYFKLQPGRSDLTEEDGPECILLGTTYIVNNRRYDLATGYGIKARITPGYNIIPELRQSKSRERTVIKDEDGLPATPRWPILKRVWCEETENIINPFIEEALEMPVDSETFEESDILIEDKEEEE